VAEQVEEVATMAAVAAEQVDIELLLVFLLLVAHLTQ
jgi:hypothetical protein